MRRTAVPRALRDRVAAQARHRCGYCQVDERYGFSLEIEHIIPKALGGPTTEQNLWLACRDCNGRKGSRIAARDPLTEEVVPLFNPRTQLWHDHFAWTPTGDRVIGLSPTGRATIQALDLNGRKRVTARQFWVAAGWHPPTD
jgi:hypothetical protein